MKKESKPGTLKQEEATDKVAIRAKKEEGLVLSCMEAKIHPKQGRIAKQPRTGASHYIACVTFWRRARHS